MTIAIFHARPRTVQPSKEWFEQVQQGVVELPLDRKKRFMDQYQLPDGDAEVFVNDVALGDYFENRSARRKPRPSPTGSSTISGPILWKLKPT